MELLEPLLCAWSGESQMVPELISSWCVPVQLYELLILTLLFWSRILGHSNHPNPPQAVLAAQELNDEYKAQKETSRAPTPGPPTFIMECKLLRTALGQQLVS